MIKSAIIFAIIGVIAGVLGFCGIIGGAFGITKLLFWAGIVIAVVLFLLGAMFFKNVTQPSLQLSEHITPAQLPGHRDESNAAAGKAEQQGQLCA